MNDPSTTDNAPRPCSDADRNPIDVLADDFLQRLHRGERPTIEAYVASHPDLAEEIEELFPALIMLEQAGVHNDLQQQPGQTNFTAGIPTRLGKYEVIREIGRGGMGVVYEAEHEIVGRRVALKVLPPEVASNARYLERFQREVRSAGRLHHTNIVPLFEVGAENGVHYYTMQFIHGQGLDKVIDQLRKIDHNSSGYSKESMTAFQSTHDLDVSVSANVHAGQSADAAYSDDTAKTGHRMKVASSGLIAEHGSNSNSETRQLYFQHVGQIGRQVADALACAHAHSILHRDIKPSNLLLDTRGDIWVADFGLAKGDDDDLTKSGDFVGTLRYMAPERLQNEQDDALADVYSLGITLYELCTLTPAFCQTDRVKLLEAIVREEPIAPRRLNPQIPRDLETIILTSIAKDPSHRYRSASAMADDLRLFLDDRPVRARRVTSAERMWRWCRRNPYQALFPAMLLLMIALTTVGSISFALIQRRHAAELAHAELESRQRLFQSHIDRGNAIRLSGRSGQRDSSMQAIESAANMLPTLGFSDIKEKQAITKLRNDVFASLALSDLSGPQDNPIALPPGWHARGIDPDYERFALTDDAGNISVRRLNDGAEIRRLPGPGFPAWIVKFSASGRYVAAKYHEPNRKGRADFMIWDTASAETIVRWKIPMNDAGFIFHPMQPHCFFHNRNRQLVHYDCQQQEFLGRANLGFESERLAIDPSGQRIALAMQDRVGVCLPSGGTVVELLTSSQIDPINDVARTATLLTSVAWSRDGQTIAAGSHNGIIYTWKIDGNETSRTGSSSVFTNKPRKLTPQRSWVAHQRRVQHLTLDSRATCIISSSWDHTVRAWNPTTGLELFRLDSFRLPPAAFGPDDQIGLTEGDHELSIRRLSNRFVTTDIPSQNSCHYWPGGNGVLATANKGEVRFWDTATAANIATAQTHDVADFLFTADGTAMLTCSEKTGVRRWPIRSEFGKPIIGEPDLVSTLPVHRLTCDRTGSVVAMRLAKNRVVVTKLTDNGSDVELSHPLASDAVVSPDGNLVVTSTWIGKGVRLWDATTGKLIVDLAPSAGTQ